MYGMWLVLPLAIAALVVIGMVASVVGFAILAFAVPAVAIAFTVFLFRKLSFRRRPIASTFALIASIGAYVWALDVMRYLILYAWRAMPLGKPWLDTFGFSGISTGFLGFVVPLIFLDHRRWGLFIEDAAKEAPVYLFGIPFVHTLIVWPVAGLVTSLMKLNLGWSDVWLRAWLFTIPALILAIVFEQKYQSKSPQD